MTVVGKAAAAAQNARFIAAKKVVSAKLAAAAKPAAKAAAAVPAKVAKTAATVVKSTKTAAKATAKAAKAAVTAAKSAKTAAKATAGKAATAAKTAATTTKAAAPAKAAVTTKAAAPAVKSAAAHAGKQAAKHTGKAVSHQAAHGAHAAHTQHAAVNSGQCSRQLPMTRRIAVISACVLGIAYCFLGLTVLCDEHLVASLEAIITKLGIPEDVAGASFLALGNAAPEITINMLATATHRANVGLSAILGSGMIAFCLIPGVCAVMSPEPLVLEAVPLVRDTVTYGIALGSLIYFVSDSRVELHEGASLFTLYAVYLVCLYVVFPRLYKRSSPPHAASGSTEGEPLINDAENDQPAGPLNGLVDALAAPFRLLYSLTIPNCAPGGGWEEWYILTFVSSFAWIAGISALVVFLAGRLACDFGLSHAMMGVTVIAMGAEVPDTFASVSVAKKGYGSMALANAIGSQITNILLGLGLPYTVSNLGGNAVEVHAGHIQTIATILLALILLLLTCCSVSAILYGSPTLTRPVGFVLIAAYVGAIAFVTRFVHAPA